MNIWYYISVLLLGLTILFVLWMIRRFKKFKTPKFKKYTLKDYLLSKNGRIVYETLSMYAGEYNLEILPKMHLSEFIYVDKKNRNAYFLIQSKFVDFLIVDNVKIKPRFAIVIEKKNLKDANLELFEGVFAEIKLKWVLIKELEFENIVALKERLKKILEEVHAG